jgi:hypothetical protein
MRRHDPAGIFTVIVDVHVATLLPRICDAVTTGRGRFRVTVSLARMVQVPCLVTPPALYRMLPADIPRPLLGFSSVATAVATQLDPSGALRLSRTATSPRRPLTLVPWGVFSTAPEFPVSDFT